MDIMQRRKVTYPLFSFSLSAVNISWGFFCVPLQLLFFLFSPWPQSFCGQTPSLYQSSPQEFDFVWFLHKRSQTHFPLGTFLHWLHTLLSQVNCCLVLYIPSFFTFKMMITIWLHNKDLSICGVRYFLSCHECRTKKKILSPHEEL